MWLVNGTQVDLMFLVVCQGLIFFMMFPPAQLTLMHRLINEELGELDKVAMTKGELLYFFGVLILVTKFVLLCFSWLCRGVEQDWVELHWCCEDSNKEVSNGVATTTGTTRKGRQEGIGLQGRAGPGGHDGICVDGS